MAQSAKVRTDIRETQPSRDDAIGNVRSLGSNICQTLVDKIPKFPHLERRMDFISEKNT